MIDCKHCVEIVKKMAEQMDASTLSVFARCGECGANWDLTSDKI